MIASTNPGKIQEYQEVIDDLGLDLVLRPAHEVQGPLDIEEDQETYLANAQKKAEAYSSLLQTPVLGDDGGLEILALPHLFGLKTQRTFPEGLSDAEKNAFILDLLEDQDERGAFLHAALYLSRPGQEDLFQEVSLAFEIADEPRGSQGFGFDPILYVREKGQTTGQMSDQERKEYSARRLAFESIIKELKNVENQ